MKKNVFGIVATMLLVETMALMSCSEDCVFGYDAEWDDFVPRTKWNIINDNQSPAIGDINYVKIGQGECALVAIAESRNQIVWMDGNMYVEENIYNGIVWEIASSTADYKNELMNDSCISRTNDEWKNIFGCTTVVEMNNNINFGEETLKNVDWYGHRNYLGEPHIDHITKYIPATSKKEAQVVTSTYGKVNLSDFDTIWK